MVTIITGLMAVFLHGRHNSISFDNFIVGGRLYLIFVVITRYSRNVEYRKYKVHLIQRTVH